MRRKDTGRGSEVDEKKDSGRVIYVDEKER